MSIPKSPRREQIIRPWKHEIPFPVGMAARRRREREIGGIRRKTANP